MKSLLKKKREKRQSQLEDGGNYKEKALGATEAFSLH